MPDELLKTGLLAAWFAALTATVVCVSLGMFTRHRNRPIIRLASENRGWIILVVLGLGLLFGAIGQYRSNPSPENIQGQFELGKFFDCLYEGALQLTINGEIQTYDSVFKRMARVAGLALIVLLAYEGIQLLFAEPLQRFWVNRYTDHVVICGLGQIGRSLVRDLTEPSPVESKTPSDKAARQSEQQMETKWPKKIVVIERNKDNSDIPWAESRVVIVVIGNAADDEVLMRVGAHRARDVFFTNGSDELNLECTNDLLRIVSLRNANQSETVPTHVPRMFVHLLKPRLETMLVEAKKRAFGSHASQSGNAIEHLVVRPFNVIDRSIQALLEGPVLERRPTSKDKDEIAHFVIVGFGEVGQELAIKLAQLAHYENLKRSRITIVYSKRDKTAVEQFQELYPKFFPKLDSFAAELAGINRRPEDYDAWMPFQEMDNWSFGVAVKTKPNPKLNPEPNDPAEVIDASLSRGVEFVANGGFVLASGGVTSDHFISKLEALSREPGVRPMVFICNAEDEQNCADATELRDELDVRLKCKVADNSIDYLDRREHRITIFPYVPNRPMLHRLIDPSDKPSADLIPWGDCRQVCTYDTLTVDMIRPLAVAINHDYDLKYAQKELRKEGEPAPTRSTVVVKSLDEMPAWKRHTNLMAAAHVNTKLAPLGLVLRPAIEDQERSQADAQRVQNIIDRSIHHQVRRDWLVESEEDRILEMVAKMEHHRWIAERLLMDWGFGDKAPNGCPENKRRIAFVDWSNLPEDEGVKDRDQIARILELCQDEAKRKTEDCRFVIISREF